MYSTLSRVYVVQPSYYSSISNFDVDNLDMLALAHSRSSTKVINISKRRNHLHKQIMSSIVRVDTKNEYVRKKKTKVNNESDT
jgi:hypothetical protein